MTNAFSDLPTENAFQDLPADNSFNDLPAVQSNSFADLPASDDGSLVDNILDSFVYAGKNIQHGYQSSSEYMYNVAANIPMMIHDTSNYLAEKTGGKPSDTTVAKTIETWLRNAAKGIAPSPDQAPQEIIGKIYSGIGAAPGAIAMFTPAVKAVGAVKGMAATEAIGAADQGLEAAAEAGAKGALMGGMLAAVAPYARSVRVPAMGAVGATQAAAEGGDVSDIVSSGIVMGGLGAMGQRGGAKLKREKVTTNAFEDLPAETKQREFAGNINLEKLNTADSVKDALKVVSKEHDSFNKARRGVVSHKETEALAVELGMSVPDLLSRRKGQAFNAHEALAARGLLVSSGERLVKLAEKSAGGSDASLVAFQNQLTRHVAIQEQVSGMTAEAGRALNQFKIQAKSSKAQLEAIQTIVESHGGRSQMEKVAKALADPKNIKQINELSRKLYQPRPIDMVVEAWINSLLSGPQTHAVNITSNAAIALWTIPENIIAAGIGKLHKGDKVTFGDAIARGYGFVEGAKQGVVRSAKALKTGEPLDPLSKLETSKYKAIPGKVGEVVRIPGRFLTAEDEFFKAIGYRMELNSLAYRTAASEGLKSRAFAKRVEELKVSPTEEMHSKATDVARYQTFTKPLGPMGKAVQSFASSHPGMRFIMPFIRTPVNIVKFAGERTALSVFSKEVRDTLKKGGAERDQQLAKIALGSMVTASVVSLVAEGLVTGGGPSDPRQKAMLYATGWQPYSVKINDKYYSYGRVEPLGMLVGVSADAAEISSKIETKDADELGAMVFASVSKNLTSKTWLKGVSDLIQAVQDPDRYGGRWIQNYAGSVVPSVVSQIARVEDPVLRETTTMLEKIKSRIYYISKSLLPRRNIWGEPIKLEGGLGPDLLSPIYVSKKKNDKVSDEMVALEIAPAMPRKKINGVQLTPNQYDKYVVLAGTKAKEYLDTIVSVPEWDEFPDYVKSRLINDAIREFRQLAKNQIMIDNPEIIVDGIEEKIKAYQ